MLEHAELYTRGLGETSDVVNKEMYTLEDKSNNPLTLRPEATASVVRAIISNDIASVMPQRLWYYGPMFRFVLAHCYRFSVTSLRCYP